MCLFILVTNIYCQWDQKQFLYSQNENLSVVLNKTNDKTFFIAETTKNENVNEGERTREKRQRRRGRRREKKTN